MYDWIMHRIYRQYEADPEDSIEYGWVFGITFFLALFLSQTIFIWLFGEVDTFLGWLFLIIISLGATSFLIFGDSRKFYKKLGVRKKILLGRVERSLKKKKVRIKDVPEIRRMVRMPSETVLNGNPEDKQLEELEKKAHDGGALISREGLQFIFDFGGAADPVLKNVIEKSKEKHPRFDGWVVLNKEQVVELLEGKRNNNENVVESSTIARTQEEDVNEEAEGEQYEVMDELHKTDIFLNEAKDDVAENISANKEVEEKHRARNVPVPVNLPVGNLQQVEATAVSSFMQYLCKGDEQGLFTFIRKLRQGSEEDVREFMREAILMLDRVHEHRVDGAGYVNREVLEHTECFTVQEIEEIISILISSVDYRYDVPETGIKLSLIRAMEYIKKARRK